MNIWWILALLSGFGLAGRNVLMKGATLKADPALAAMILSVSMAVVSIGWLAYSRVMKGEPVFSTANGSFEGMVMALFAGVALAGANIFLASAYKAGGDAGVVAIIQNGVSISLTIALGVLFLHEIIKPHQMIGIALAMAGIFLIVKK